jgi:hypothetical protein
MPRPAVHRPYLAAGLHHAELPRESGWQRVRQSLWLPEYTVMHDAAVGMMAPEAPRQSRLPNLG